MGEETAAHASDTLAKQLMKNGKQKLKLNFPDDDTSKFVGVSYCEKKSKWRAQRWSKNENKVVANGIYDDEETAAHATDTLARKLMENGEQNHKLNFPDDHTEMRRKERKIASKFMGVAYDKNKSKWCVRRWSKNEYKNVSFGNYDDEETAAHASDTLVRKLMENGEQKHKLNFPDDDAEVYPKEKRFTSKFIGVSYCETKSKWFVQRHSKDENKQFSKGCYGDEETAAHASDTLARKLMENGEQKLKLNFPNDHTEVYPAQQKKRKRPKDLNLEHPQIN